MGGIVLGPGGWHREADLVGLLVSQCRDQSLEAELLTHADLKHLLDGHAGSHRDLRLVLPDDICSQAYMFTIIGVEEH